MIIHLLLTYSIIIIIAHLLIMMIMVTQLLLTYRGALTPNTNTIIIHIITSAVATLLDDTIICMIR